MFIAKLESRMNDKIFSSATEGRMKYEKNIRRIEEICEELMEIVDDSRALGENDESELVCCVVHDSVQKMRRAVERWNPNEACDAGTHRPKSKKQTGRIVN